MTAEPVLDAHHHVWWLARTPWLAGPPAPRIFGEHDAIRRDYLVEEYAADACGAGVVASIYVQVNVAAGDEVDEVAWVTRTGAGADLMQGVVAYADLSAPGVGEVLDRQLAAGLVRGVRQQLHWHAEPSYRFAARPDLMLDRDWRRGLAEVGARGLVFELQVFPGQYADALATVDAFPDVTFVLLHAGMPEDPSPDARGRWRAGLDAFAERENVVTKLSGLGTFVRRCTVEDWRPVVEQTLDAFGPGRCLFGSNFPIEKLWTSYDELLRVFRACLAGLSAGERRDVLGATAARVYRLPVPQLAPPAQTTTT